MELRLILPSEVMQEKALAFRQAFFDHGETVIDGSELFDRIEEYADWLDHVRKNADPATVSPDWVVTDTYFAVDERDEIVGIIDLRHELKGFLTDFGHTGYSVRPDERRKGYATRMLELIVERAREVGLSSLQLSAERSNTASVRTIVKNGGVFERSFDFNDSPADVYKIRLL